MDDIADDITGETTTSEKRKMRSATQRAASRWWNTEAIDLEIYLYIIFIRTKSGHCLVLSLSQSVSHFLLFVNFVQIRFVKVVRWIFQNL